MPDQSTTAPVAFKPIPGWPAYRVGDDGSAWSLFRRGRCKAPGDVWRMLRPRLNRRTGRLMVALFSGDGRRKMVDIHTLVMLAFVGPRPDGLEVCHENGVATDNRLSNLRYDTHRGNEADKIRHGTSPVGVRHGNAKLTDDVVREIRRRCEWDENQYDVAKSLGVSQTTVSRVAARAIWSHVKD